jgi:hypothetical protein
MNITLKNLPEAVYRVVKEEARQQGRSINAQIIRALETEVPEIERRRRLSEGWKELDRFAASLPLVDDSTPLIRRDRYRLSNAERAGVGMQCCRKMGITRNGPRTKGRRFPMHGIFRHVTFSDPSALRETLNSASPPHPHKCSATHPANTP